MIDKAIAQQLAKQEAAGAPAPVEAAEPAELSYADEPNQTVNSLLNHADLSFSDRQQREGCQSVSQAITAASISPVSPDQSEQLKSYAARCNLRY